MSTSFPPRHYLPVESLKKRAEKRKHLCSSVVPVSKPITLPHALSLNKYRNFIYDQGELGSCTSNAFCAAYRIMDTIHQKNVSFEPSRLFFYYQERLTEGTVGEDSGADVIDGESYVKTNGICSEKTWSYDISKFSVPPPPETYKEAQSYKISSYTVLQNGPAVINEIKHAIYNKQPVLIAILLYDSFESEQVAKTGHVPMPDTTKENCLGGHEMCLIGYNDATHNFIVMNSWGGSWGDHGICYIPYNYVSNADLGLEFTVFQL
jgi:C1A family cysteine protease